jgi:cytochrome c6
MSDHARRQWARLSAIVPALLVLAPLTAEAMTDKDDQLELGRQVFLELAQPSCGICHTLADAGTRGTIAPNLDRLRPTEERVRAAMVAGPGAMPDYSDRLTQDESEAVARYVA